VIDVAGLAPVESRIDNEILVKSAEVAIAYTQLLIVDFSLLSNWVSDPLTHVLDHYLLWLDRLVCKEAISVDFADPDNCLLWSLLRSPVLHGDVIISAGPIVVLVLLI